jgi:hypothetical protein
VLGSEDAKLRRAIVRLVEEIVPETLCFRTNASRPSVRAGGIDEMIGDLN